MRANSKTVTSREATYLILDIPATSGYPRYNDITSEVLGGKMTDPQNLILEIIFGRWRSQILYAGVKLGVFDALANADKDATLIAQNLGLDPGLSYRLLRALACLGVLTEDENHRFSLSAAGEFLRADHPETLRGVTLLEEGPEHYALWKHLPEMVREGKQNAFMREFGQMAFEHADRNPAYAQVFDQAMSSYSGTEAAWVLEALEGHDFSGISHLCDVGGGRGHLLCSFLAKYNHLKGTVIERAEVIHDKASLWADKMNVGDRCSYLAGDMFQEVPPADAYIMKHIIHDWNDEECVQILSNLHRSAAPAAKVFIAEYVVPDPNTPHFAKLFDIHMMCWGTGRERTSTEYAALLEQADWKYVDTWFPISKAIGVVEGRKG
jgi:hypothetical protein